MPGVRGPAADVEGVRRRPSHPTSRRPLPGSTGTRRRSPSDHEAAVRPRGPAPRSRTPVPPARARRRAGAPPLTANASTRVRAAAKAPRARPSRPGDLRTVAEALRHRGDAAVHRDRHQLPSVGRSPDAAPSRTRARSRSVGRERREPAAEVELHTEARAAPPAGTARTCRPTRPSLGAAGEHPVETAAAEQAQPARRPRRRGGARSSSKESSTGVPV